MSRSLRSSSSRCVRWAAKLCLQIAEQILVGRARRRVAAAAPDVGELDRRVAQAEQIDAEEGPRPAEIARVALHHPEDLARLVAEPLDPALEPPVADAASRRRRSGAPAPRPGRWRGPPARWRSRRPPRGPSSASGRARRPEGARPPPRRRRRPPPSSACPRLERPPARHAGAGQRRGEKLARDRRRPGDGAGVVGLLGAQPLVQQPGRRASARRRRRARPASRRRCRAPIAPSPAKSSGSGARNISRARRLTRLARRLRNGGCGAPAASPGGPPSGEYLPP